MGEPCKLQCERKCQVWQLAVGGDANPGPHLHMPCLPGGGKPGGGMTLRTYQGGCRSACSGSVRHPVQHMYPAGRIKRWFFDTKEWFWDGMLVMKTENPTKSASHFCLPYPLPTMRLPRSYNSRLVEVHHVHPPPSTGVGPNELGDGTVPQNPDKSTTPMQNPLKEGAEPQPEVKSGNLPMDSQRSDPIESQASGDKQTSTETAVANEPRETGAENQTMPTSLQVMRISHINVGDGPPQLENPGEPQPERVKYYKESSDRNSELTYVNYRAASLCPKCFHGRCSQGAGCFPCIPTRWKFLVRRGVVFCFARTASACLCLSSTCATISFCFRNVARNVDAVATTAVDVKELVNCYVFIADMPGLKNTEIKVQVENNSVLKISGDRTRDEYGLETEVKYIRLERNPGRVIRKFNLPANTNLDSISAACQDGVLTVIVSKNPAADPHRPRSFDVDVHSDASSVSRPPTASNAT